MGIGKFFKNIKSRLLEIGDNRNTVTGKASDPVSVGASPLVIGENHQEVRLPSAGNVNKGPGAGAHNTGSKAASINNNRRHINFSNRDIESVPIQGNVNKGPGAGGINSGMEAGSINGNQGVISF